MAKKKTTNSPKETAKIFDAIIKARVSRNPKPRSKKKDTEITIKNDGGKLMSEKEAKELDKIRRDNFLSEDLGITEEKGE